MFQGSFKSVSRKFLEEEARRLLTQTLRQRSSRAGYNCQPISVSRFNGVSMLNVSRKFPRSFKDVSRALLENFKGISRKFQGCFKED